VNVQEERAVGVHVIASRFVGRIRLANQREMFRYTSDVSPGEASRLQAEIQWSTIALLMLAPCPASSKLFASLPPGRRPGFRALTTPPRGTFSPAARWSPLCRLRE